MFGSLNHFQADRTVACGSPFLVGGPSTVLGTPDWPASPDIDRHRTATAWAASVTTCGLVDGSTRRAVCFLFRLVAVFQFKLHQKSPHLIRPKISASGHLRANFFQKQPTFLIFRAFKWTRPHALAARAVSSVRNEGGFLGSFFVRTNAKSSFIHQRLESRPLFEFHQVKLQVLARSRYRLPPVARTPATKSRFMVNLMGFTCPR